VSVSRLAQALRRTQVMAGRLLLVIADEDTSDRFAHALAQTGGYAFMFANELGDAVAIAKTAQPDLAIIAAPSDRGIAICQALRKEAELAGLRLLLVVDRVHLAEARWSGANGYLLEPASAILVAAEVSSLLARRERRGMIVERRRMARGGRRLTDIQFD
jgi:DNA-binding response OmpR family regulator